MNDVLDRIAEVIKNSNNTKATKILIPKQESVLISDSYFHDIAEVECDSKVCFIDGGNNEILKTPSMSLQFIRVYYNIYSSNKKVSSKKCEFFALVESEIVDEKVKYKTRIFVQKGGVLPREQDMVFSADDFTLKEGVAKASVSKISEVVRKYAEWTMCIEAMKELDAGDFIVKDGTLDADFVNEVKYKQAVLENAKEKDIVVSGLAKTNTILADNGESAGKVLGEMCSLGIWKYYPVVKNDKIYFVKLNNHSKHVFRLDVIGGNIEKLLSLLVDNSTDPVFLGYPYGLIDADRFARVSNQEKEYLMMKLQVKMGKGFLELEKAISSVNAHKILDSV